LAFFSTLAATPPRTLSEEQIVERQRAMLGAPERDVFLPFRFGGAAAAVDLPSSFPPLTPVSLSGSRFATVAPGVAESRLVAEVPSAGMILFPVPFHPRLEGRVGGKREEPVPELPGHRAVLAPAR